MPGLQGAIRSYEVGSLLAQGSAYLGDCREPRFTGLYSPFRREWWGEGLLHDMCCADR